MYALLLVPEDCRLVRRHAITCLRCFARAAATLGLAPREALPSASSVTHAHGQHGRWSPTRPAPSATDNRLIQSSIPSHTRIVSANEISWLLTSSWKANVRHLLSVFTYRNRYEIASQFHKVKVQDQRLSFATLCGLHSAILVM